jgi:hypothetical protein
MGRSKIRITHVYRRVDVVDGFFAITIHRWGFKYSCSIRRFTYMSARYLQFGQILLRTPTSPLHFPLSLSSSHPRHLAYFKHPQRHGILR